MTKTHQPHRPTPLTDSATSDLVMTQLDRVPVPTRETRPDAFHARLGSVHACVYLPDEIPDTIRVPVIGYNRADELEEFLDRLASRFGRYRFVFGNVNGAIGADERQRFARKTGISPASTLSSQLTDASMCRETWGEEPTLSIEYCRDRPESPLPPTIPDSHS